MNHDNVFTDILLKYVCKPWMRLDNGQDSSILNSDTMIDHIKNQNIFDKHRSQSMKLITEYYTTLWLHHFSKMHILKEKTSEDNFQN